MSVSLTSKFYKIIHDCRHIVLGIGPVSVNCVDAAIEASRSLNMPIILVASRRQVDMAELGGGYVNRWTTEAFAAYVRVRAGDSPVFLERDHGGPWQNEVESQRGFDFTRAMASAKASYESDILAGFDILHLDPNDAGPQGNSVDYSTFTDRTKELYLHCHEFAQLHGRTICFEIATDKGNIGRAPGAVTEKFLSDILTFCKVERLPLPDFAVLPTGSEVMETRNVGPLDGWIRHSGGLPSDHPLPNLSRYCHANGLFVKEHNADYLSAGALAWHSKSLIDSVNVAPEFGVAETRTFLQIIDDLGRPDLRDKFIHLALESGKWKKWMLPDSSADDREKAIIAGHYLFSMLEFLEIKAETAQACERRGYDLDDQLCAAVSASIRRYLEIFQKEVR